MVPQLDEIHKFWVHFKIIMVSHIFTSAYEARIGCQGWLWPSPISALVCNLPIATYQPTKHSKVFHFVLQCTSW
jgi:hypothetical protein